MVIIYVTVSQEFRGGAMGLLIEAGQGKEGFRGVYEACMKQDAQKWDRDNYTIG
jgi:hypothetical protein